MTIETFSTDRLIVERMREDHFDNLLAMHQDPRVMATLTRDGKTLSEDQTREWIQINLDHWAHHGCGVWIFYDKTDGQFVGRSGLRHCHVGGHDEVELHYALMAEYWGKGLATEMAKAVMKVGFEQLGLKDVVCFTLTTNKASQRVMGKAGFIYERDIVHADLPHVFYRIITEDR